MPKSSRQKLKILYIAQILNEKSDEEHPVSVRTLIQELQNQGIEVERKAIYDDIDTLRSFGMEIENRRKKPSGFYLVNRRFTTEELRLLADAVLTVPFISEEKSRKLISGLKELACSFDREKFPDDFSERKNGAAPDEHVYDAMDRISRAMEEDRQILFQYVQWTVDKKLELRHQGEAYHVSPWGIMRSEGYYYMIGIDEYSHIVKHFRIDKMREISIGDGIRTGHKLFERFQAKEFAMRTFGMFGGKEETVTVRFENHLAGILIERFGENVRSIPKDPEHFHALLRVQVSRQFFGWLAGIGGGAEIVAPQEVRNEYTRFLRKALEVYQ